MKGEDLVGRLDLLRSKWTQITRDMSAAVERAVVERSSIDIKKGQIRAYAAADKDIRLLIEDIRREGVEALPREEKYTQRKKKAQDLHYVMHVALRKYSDSEWSIVLWNMIDTWDGKVSGLFTDLVVDLIEEKGDYSVETVMYAFRKAAHDVRYSYDVRGLKELEKQDETYRTEWIVLGSLLTLMPEEEWEPIVSAIVESGVLERSNEEDG